MLGAVSRACAASWCPVELIAVDAAELRTGPAMLLTLCDSEGRCSVLQPLSTTYVHALVNRLLTAHSRRPDMTVAECQVHAAMAMAKLWLRVCSA